jgi:transposase InsO family protein
MSAPTSDHAWDLALARYAVIAPLVCRSLEPAEREVLRKEILAALHRFPGERHRRIAPRTLRDWCQRYRQGGIDRLRPGGRKDRGVPRAVPPEVIARAKALKAELPARSSRAIADLLVAEGQGALAASTLRYHLSQAELPPKPTGENGSAKAYRRFEHPRPNDCWQSDMSDGLWLPDPADPSKQRKCHAHGFIDDHSRLVTHVQFYWRESLPALENCFRQAIARHGIPRMVYWDNGSAYRARQLRKMAARLGTEVVFATPYAPEGKGKIERFWGTLKAIFYPEAQAAGIQTLEELNTFLWAWLERHYTHRVHSETGQAPLDRWEAGREHVRTLTPEDLADTFLWEEDRQVTRTGDVQLAGNRYPVPAELVGQRVVVRYDPFDLAEVQIVLKGRLVGTFRPAQLVTRTFSKAQPRQEPPRHLDSATAFKQRLVSEVAARDQAWSSLAAGAPTTQTDAEFELQLADLLGGRLFSEAERQALAHFKRRYAPRPERTDRAVMDAVAIKGIDRPLAYYLDAIEAALTSPEA